MSNQIIVGNTDQQIYNQNRIRSLSGSLASTVSGSELVFDELTATLDVSDFLPEDGSAFSPWPYGTPLWYKHNSNVIGGRFYITNPRRVGKHLWELLAVSAIGILDSQDHVGGMYTGQKFGDVAEEIIGGTVSYTVSPGLADLPIYGWLPYQSKRANLHQLVFAVGASVVKDDQGDMVFKFPDASKVKPLNNRRLYQGGNVDYLSPANCVDVTEHTFFALDNDQETTLFDNTDGSTPSDQTTVIFQKAPVHDLATTGTLSILESNCNYAVVQGVGTLTGKLYTHATRIIHQSTETAPAEPKTVSVTDAYLVNLANSKNLAKRMLAYHSSAYSVGVDIVWDGERPGDQLSFTNPFDEETTAFLSSLEFRASTVLKASCEMIAGYKPQSLGNNYSAVVVLEGSGSWTPPEGVTSGMVVLVGGGDGGGNGLPGAEGASGSGEANGMGGAGGGGGNGGLGGRILTIDATFNGNAIKYSCGKGGAGALAAAESASGSPGTDTTFGPYSSANGQRSPAGVVNLFTGSLFGGDGDNGVAGGNGSQTGAVYVLEGRYKVLDGGASGNTVTFLGQSYTPGANGASADYAFNAAGGGGGGGAAVGANGGVGGNGAAINLDDPNVGADSEMYTIGGKGGAGADAIPGANADTPGKGGGGGHGGGGGGGGGGAGYYFSRYGTFTVGEGGAAGQGSAGGKGGDGAILIYY